MLARLLCPDAAFGGPGTALAQPDDPCAILTPADLGDMGLLLRFRANGLDDLAGEVVDGDGDGGGGADPGNLGHGHAEGDDSRFGAAVLLLDVDTHESQGSELVQVGDQGFLLLGLLGLGRNRRQLGCRYPPGGLLDQFLFIVEV